MPVQEFDMRPFIVAAALLASAIGPAHSQAAEPVGYACQTGARRILQLRPGAHCLPIYADDGFTVLINSPAIIVTGHASSAVRQGSTVKLWEQVFLAIPVTDVKGHFRYDRLKASYQYDCRTRQQLLIQGTYSLGPGQVYDRLSNEAVTEEVEPGTVAEALLNGFCGVH